MDFEGFEGFLAEMLLRVFNLYTCTYTHMHIYTCTHTQLHLYSCTHPYTYGGWGRPQVTYPPPDDVPPQVTSYDIVLYSMHATYAIQAHRDFSIGAELSPLSTTDSDRIQCDSSQSIIANELQEPYVWCSR